MTWYYTRTSLCPRLDLPPLRRLNDQLFPVHYRSSFYELLFQPHVTTILLFSSKHRPPSAECVEYNEDYDASINEMCKTLDIYQTPTRRSSLCGEWLMQQFDVIPMEDIKNIIHYGAIDESESEGESDDEVCDEDVYNEFKHASFRLRRRAYRSAGQPDKLVGVVSARSTVETCEECQRRSDAKRLQGDQREEGHGDQDPGQVPLIGYIMTLGVHANHRQKGLGSFLLAIIQHRLKHQTPSITRLQLHVLPSNSAAIALYRRAGFSITQLIPSHYLMKGQQYDALQMDYWNIPHSHVNNLPPLSDVYDDDDDWFLLRYATSVVHTVQWVLGALWDALPAGFSKGWMGGGGPAAPSTDLRDAV